MPAAMVSSEKKKARSKIFVYTQNNYSAISFL